MTSMLCIGIAVVAFLTLPGVTGWTLGLVFLLAAAWLYPKPEDF
jgi:hypothetical protein